MPTVDSSATLYAYANKNYVFGYYRTSSTGYNLYVNGSTWNYNANCTRTAIGTGGSNTEKLVNAMADLCSLDFNILFVENDVTAVFKGS